MDRIKTFEEACEKLGIDPKNTIPDFSMFPKEHQAAMIAHSKLIIINQALNEEWQPDWTNGKFDKYYPWFKMGSPSGDGFSYGGYDHWNTVSDVGSRLCFKNRELAEYAGKTFLQLYKEYFVK